MSIATVNEALPSAGWLRSRGFDLGFIVAVAAIGLASGFAASLDHRLLLPIIMADLWLLGYHHVISTYTRLAFDRESFRANRFILLQLPFIVIAGVLLLAVGLGLWSIVSLYLYWQWFHYARQSWGVAQVYRRKAGGIAGDNPTLTQINFWLVPLWGILNRSYQAPDEFLSMPLRVLPVPGLLVDIVGLAAVAGVIWWAVTRVQLWWQGRLPVAHTIYMLSHYVIFFVGYIVIADIDAGWVTANIWHNAQYILFVWMFNTNKFKGGVEAQAKFLSTISQTRNAWLYFFVCLGISTAIYLMLKVGTAAVPALLLSYQIINFHHYVADSLIWKVRRKNLQKTLGIAS